MRVLLDGLHYGDLVVNESEILHFVNGISVQKFYQQMLVTFTPEDIGVGRSISWAVSNWGPNHENGPRSDLKGGIKVVAYSSAMGARQANQHQLRTKLNKGYQHHHTYTVGEVHPATKLMTTIGAVFARGKSVPAPAREFKVERPSEEEAHSGNPMTNLQTSVSELSKITLRAISRDDIPSAINSRRALIALISEVNSLQENAAGQLEILNAKLSEALR